MAREIESQLRITAQNQTGAAFREAARDASNSARSIARSYDEVTLGIQRLGGGVLGVRRRLGTALAAFVGGEELRKSFMEFAQTERRMTRLGINAEASVRVTADARREIMGIAQESGQSFNQVLEGVEALVRATGQNLPGAILQTRELAAANQAMGAEMGDTGKTWQVMHDTMKVGNEDMKKAFAMVLEAARSGKFEAKDLAHYIPMLGADMAAAGYQGADGLAKFLGFLEAIHTETGDAEHAANALRDILAKINTPETASHFEKQGVNLKASLDEARRSGADMMSAMADITERTLKRMTETRRIPKEQWRSLIPELFTEIDSRRAMSVLLDRQKVAKFIDQIRSAQPGLVDETKERVLKDSQTSVERLSLAWDALKYSMGSAMAQMGLTTGLEATAGKLMNFSEVVGNLKKSLDDFALSYGMTFGRIMREDFLHARQGERENDAAKLLDQLFEAKKKLDALEATPADQRKAGDGWFGFTKGWQAQKDQAVADIKELDQLLEQNKGIVENLIKERARLRERDERERAKARFKWNQGYEKGGPEGEAKRRSEVTRGLEEMRQRERESGLEGSGFQLPEAAQPTVEPRRQEIENALSEARADRDRLSRVGSGGRGSNWERQVESNRVWTERLERMLAEIPPKSSDSLGSNTETTQRQVLDEMRQLRGTIQRQSMRAGGGGGGGWGYGGDTGGGGGSWDSGGRPFGGDGGRIWGGGSGGGGGFGGGRFNGLGGMRRGGGGFSGGAGARGPVTRNYPKGLADAIQTSAKDLGINAEDLATAISFETAGTYNPNKLGPTTKWGQHKGLIQWGGPQREKYGITDDMSVGDQMKAVTRYLRDNGVRPGMSGENVYAAINAGNAQKTGASDAGAGGTWGTVADKWRYQMAAHRENAKRLLGGATGDMGSGGQEMVGGGKAPADTGDLRVKGAQATAGGGHHEALTEAMKWAQGNVPGFNRVTAFNDQYHQGTGSGHARGAAADFTTTGNPRNAMGALTQQLRSQGYEPGRDFKMINEYENPSSRATAGHIHFEWLNKEAADKYAASQGKGEKQGQAAIEQASAKQPEQASDAPAPPARPKDIDRGPNVGPRPRLGDKDPREKAELPPKDHVVNVRYNVEDFPSDLVRDRGERHARHEGNSVMRQTRYAAFSDQGVA